MLLAEVGAGPLPPVRSLETNEPLAFGWLCSVQTCGAPQAAAPPQKPGRKQQKPKTEESRTIYLGHIPHGFYEKEMEGFFSQFGVVTNLRLSRSKDRLRLFRPLQHFLL